MMTAAMDDDDVEIGVMLLAAAAAAAATDDYDDNARCLLQEVYAAGDVEIDKSDSLVHIR